MTKPKGLILLGPPGSGKGTQAQILADSLQMPHISTGEILREAIAKGTDLGKQAQSYVDKGELVPDQLLLDLIENRLQAEDAQQGWILDGFPRTVAQASFLDKLLTEKNQFSACIVNLEVPNSTLKERLLGRGRKDDNEETISRRLQVYQEQTAPVLDYYEKQGHLNSIDGNCSLEEVAAALKKVVMA